MPRSKQGKKVQSNKGNVNNPPGVNMIVYRGPSKLNERVNPEYKTFELHAFAQATTIVTTGAIDLNVSSNTVRTLANDFSSFAALYREYRVLAIRVEFIPMFENDHVGTPATTSAVPPPILYFPFVTVIDRDDASAIGLLNNVASNTSLRIFPINCRWMREAKMDSTVEAEFIPVNSDPAAFFAIKFATEGSYAAATNLGIFYYTYIVQFKTRI